MSIIETRNPTTGELIKTYTVMTSSEVDVIIDDVHLAFQEWQNTSFALRKKLMQKVAAILKDNSQEYAKLMAMEMGKPFKSGISEVEKCAWCCDFFAQRAEEFLAPEQIATDASKSYITFRPLGAILAIMPWNFPFWQVFRFAAPTLMAGNVALLKHAAITTGCGLVIEEIFKKAGFPKESDQKRSSSGR